MKSAYISCPMTVSQESLDNVINLILDYGASPLWWTKGSVYDEKYYTDLISNADAFIIMLPGLSWKCSYAGMTSGSRKELIIAAEAGKPIFVAYVAKGWGLGLYAADLICDKTACPSSITGIASTRHNFQQSFGGTDQVMDTIQTKVVALPEHRYSIGNTYYETWQEVEQELIRRGFTINYKKVIVDAVDAITEALNNPKKEKQNRILLFF